MKKQTYPYTATIIGSDARVLPDFSREVKLRETAKYWVTETGRKFHKVRLSGIGAWPIYRIKPDSIKPVLLPLPVSDSGGYVQ